MNERTYLLTVANNDIYK